MDAPTHADYARWAENNVTKALGGGGRQGIPVAQTYSGIAIAQALLALYGLLDERLDGKPTHE